MLCSHFLVLFLNSCHRGKCKNSRSLTVSWEKVTFSFLHWKELKKVIKLKHPLLFIAEHYMGGGYGVLFKLKTKEIWRGEAYLAKYCTIVGLTWKVLLEREEKKSGNKMIQWLQNLKSSRVFQTTQAEAGWGPASPVTCAALLLQTIVFADMFRLPGFWKF